MASPQPSGALLGTLFGQPSRSSLLKGALTVGLTPPQAPMGPIPETRELATHSQSETPPENTIKFEDKQSEVGSVGMMSISMRGIKNMSKRGSNQAEAVQQPDPVTDVFSYYNRDSDGLLTKEQFARAVRACGGCPTEKQVDHWFADLFTYEDPQVVPDKPSAQQASSIGEKQSQGRPKTVVMSTTVHTVKSGISKKTFVEEISRLIQESPGPSRVDILESLKTFTVQKDNQPGITLETETIRTVLGGMGPEHLQPLEVEAVLVGLEHKPGQIHFGSMLDRLSQRLTVPTLLGGAQPKKHAPQHTGAAQQRTILKSR